MGNMRFKVGDHVRIKSLDWYNENKTIHGDVWLDNAVFVGGQSLYCGCELTIRLVTNDSYYVIENDYYWTNEMIEGLVEEETYDFLKTDKPNLPSLNDFMDMLNNEIKLPEGYQFKDENGNVINATKIVLEKKKKGYPKTYEECAKIMNCPITGPSGWLFNFDANIKDPYYRKIDILMGKFTRLLICRDAYWKIAGEEMGLGKPWEPDWANQESPKYCIAGVEGQVKTAERYIVNTILAFPTAEMRDAFYEVFREEIEICKELL